MCKFDLATSHVLPDSKDCILEKLRQDEISATYVAPDALNEATVTEAYVRWSKPPTVPNDVMQRAHLAAFYNGISVDNDGHLMLPDLKSNDLDKRSVAELIAAVFSVGMVVMELAPHVYGLVA